MMSTPTPNRVGPATTGTAAATNVAATTDVAAELDRDQVQARLEGAGFMSPDHPHFMHGRLFGSLHPDSAEPRVKWTSTEPPRKDHGEGPAWLTATEYADQGEVLRAKCGLLSSLLKLSRRTAIYSGAGISRASGINQAALGSKGLAKQVNWRHAQPTVTHHALTALEKAGMIQNWIQQNHDGLPQKAGYPQSKINEIHGSWFDPSNVVVKYDGSLRDDLYNDMVEEAEEADLVLVVGTSLSGLNSDQLATTPARKSLGPLSARRGGGSDRDPRLGTVIINLQQTPEDGKASLRVFSTADMALTLVLDSLGIACPAELPAFLPSPTAGRVHGEVGWGDRAHQTRSLGRRVLVPYDRDGVRIPREEQGTTPWMWLDLRDGARIKLGAHHNCQGAKQPAYIHLGRAGKTGVPGDATGTVRALDSEASSFQLLIEGAVMTLGCWWLEVAQHGTAGRLPVVNPNPAFERAAIVEF